MSFTLFLTLLFALNTFGNVLSEFSNVVTLSHGGQIQGHQLRSNRNNYFLAFQEIPYAAPPVGKLRFKEAMEPTPWTGILETTKNTKICMQLERNDFRETEDCLYLNVYVPKTCRKDLLPVYVYLHGGVFHKGDGTFESFGPHFLMDYGIILVTLNYRLGAFGFISTENEVLPGNLGLKDQNLALQWVQKNIHLFGGDPKKVTLGGQSAGACCVGHHVLSKRSQGLFRAAIQESGSPINSKMFTMHPRYFAFQLGHLLNNNISEKNSSRQLLEVLMTVSAAEIKKHSNLPIPSNMRNGVGNEANTVWNPVEEYIENGFIRDLMHENFKTGIFNKLPVLIGFNSEEEVSFDLNVLKAKAKYFDENSSHLINGNLHILEENRLPAGTKLKKVYTDKTFEEDFPAFVRFVSDIKYVNGVCRQAELQSNYTDLFLYQFAYDGALGGVNITTSGIVGVGHNEELNYLFQNNFNREISTFPKNDLRIQKQLLTIWTNFIKYLNPVGRHGLIFLNVDWPKVTPDLLVYLNINGTLGVKKYPRNYLQVKNVYQNYAEDLQYTY